MRCYSDFLPILFLAVSPDIYIDAVTSVGAENLPLLEYVKAFQGVLPLRSPDMNREFTQETSLGNLRRTKIYANKSKYLLTI